MPREPATKPSTPPKGGDKVLAIKDGLREARFNLRRGARKLVDAAEASSMQRLNEGAEDPLALLGRPLNLALRTTAAFLNNIDHAVVDLLTADGPYRAGAVPLRGSAAYFGVGHVAADLRLFSTDFQWRYRHWLAMSGRDDVFVHEQAIEIAGERVAADPSVRALCDGPFESDEAMRTNAAVIRALIAEEVLSQSTLWGDDPIVDLATLASLGAVVTVLAGEVARLAPGLDVRIQYHQALLIADEIARGALNTWEIALTNPRPVESMAQWLAFALRYV